MYTHLPGLPSVILLLVEPQGLSASDEQDSSEFSEIVVRGVNSGGCTGRFAPVTSEDDIEASDTVK